MKLQIAVASSVIGLIVGAGCSTWTDITTRDDVQNTKIVGKTYTLQQPGYVYRVDDRLTLDSKKVFEDTHEGVVPAGTRIRIDGVMKQYLFAWPEFTGSFYSPVGQPLEGPYQHDRLIVESGFVHSGELRLPAATWPLWFGPPETTTDDSTIERAFIELDSDHWEARFSAAEFLRSSRPHTSEVKGRISERLSAEIDPDVRFRLLLALLDSPNDPQGETLIELLEGMPLIVKSLQ